MVRNTGHFLLSSMLPAAQCCSSSSVCGDNSCPIQEQSTLPPEESSTSAYHEGQHALQHLHMSLFLRLRVICLGLWCGLLLILLLRMLLLFLLLRMLLLFLLLLILLLRLRLGVVLLGAVLLLLLVCVLIQRARLCR